MKTPKQRLRETLKGSGAVVPQHLLPLIHGPVEVKAPPVRQVLEFAGTWHPLAIQKMRNFFDQARQLRAVYHANGNTYLEVEFDNAQQAGAFETALRMGQFGNPKKN